MEAHRDNYVALVDLWGRRGEAEEENRFSADAYEPSRHYLSHILEAGHERGEFRRLPVRVTASLIQATIDGVMLQWVFEQASVDLDVSRAEVLEMITRHVSPVSPVSQGETS
jgi:hypothetical protein